MTPTLGECVGDSLGSMFLTEWALHAATMYTMTSITGVRRGGQFAVQVPEGEGVACSNNVHNDLYSRCMPLGTVCGGQPSVHVPERERVMHAATLYTCCEEQLQSMFLKERVLHAATMYTMTSPPVVRRGGQPSVHVPEGEGAACSHIVHNDLYSRCTPWGTAFGPCSWRSGCCIQPQCTQWHLLQAYAVGDSLQSMYLKEVALHAATMYTMTSTPGAVEDSLRSMFLKERALHAATMYTMTSTLCVHRGGQPSVHVPEGEGAACSHNVHNDLYSRCTPWGTAFGPCSWRRERCCGRGHPPASPGLCRQGILVFSTSTIAALTRCWLGYPEKLDRGGPCWLLKLRWMGTQRGQMKRALSWLVCWACADGTRDFCSALAALVGPVQNIFFLTVHYFNSFVFIPQQAGQSAVLGRLSLFVFVSGGYLVFLLKLWAAFRHGRRFLFFNNFDYWKLCYSFLFCILLHSAFVLFYFLFTFLGASGLMMRF